jgi:hypothetical protein
MKFRHLHSTKGREPYGLFVLLVQLDFTIGDLNFLLEGDNLLQFVKLANKSEWLPHYYNSLYFTIKNERNDKRKEQLFLKIEEFIVKEYQNFSWRMLNLFIINAFSDEVLKKFKDIFLKHIRNHLPVSGN